MTATASVSVGLLILKGDEVDSTFLYPPFDDRLNQASLDGRWIERDERGDCTWTMVEPGVRLNMGSSNDHYSDTGFYNRPEIYQAIRGSTELDIQVKITSWNLADVSGGGIVMWEEDDHQWYWFGYARTSGAYYDRFVFYENYSPTWGRSYTQSSRSAPTLPEWYRLKLTGGVMTCYTSTDGFNWTERFNRTAEGTLTVNRIGLTGYNFNANPDPAIVFSQFVVGLAEISPETGKLILKGYEPTEIINLVDEQPEVGQLILKGEEPAESLDTHGPYIMPDHFTAPTLQPWWSREDGNLGDVETMFELSADDLRLNSSAGLGRSTVSQQVVLMQRAFDQDFHLVANVETTGLPFGSQYGGVGFQAEASAGTGFYAGLLNSNFATYWNKGGDTTAMLGQAYSFGATAFNSNLTQLHFRRTGTTVQMWYNNSATLTANWRQLFSTNSLVKPIHRVGLYARSWEPDDPGMVGIFQFFRSWKYKSPETGLLLFKGYTVDVGVRVTEPETGLLHLIGHEVLAVAGISVEKSPEVGRLLFKGAEVTEEHQVLITPDTGVYLLKGSEVSFNFATIVRPEIGRLSFIAGVPEEEKKLAKTPVVGKLHFISGEIGGFHRAWEVIAAQSSSWSVATSASTGWTDITEVSTTWIDIR